MKKHILLVLAIALFSSLSLIAQNSTNNPKHEFRATWLSTVTNIDWPSAQNLSAAQQKEELNSILNSLRDANINAVCFQVRSQCDAFYESEYEPWAAELTGTRGEGPGYDPLQYAIEQAHARGIEIHVWVNPFRVVSHKIKPKDETPGEQNSAYRYHPISTSDLLFTHTGSTVTPEMVIEYTTGTKYDANKQVEANTTKFGQVLNPGYEGVRQHIVKVILDIVERYDIDGVVMDDYFYPSVDALTSDDYDRDIRPANFDAIEDVNKNGNKVDDWRRSNVDDLIQRIYNGIKDSSKPWVRFGMGPGGVWSNEPDAHAAYGLTMPSTAAKASNPYSSLCCNTVEWIKQGWVDYVNPQIYWTMDASVANYVELCKWWGNICELYSNLLPEKQRVHFYPSQAGYKVYNYDTENSKYAYPEFGEGNPAEIINQINEVNRENLSSGYTGSVIFSNKDFLKMKDAVKAACYQQKALVPPMAWKSTEVLDAPNTLRINGKTLTWQHANADRFTVYIYPKGVRMSQAIEDVNYLQGVVYGKSFTLPNSFDITTHNVAVRAYDRYAVEHEAAEYGPDVTYVLNGGVLEYTDEIEVPTNAELWGTDPETDGQGYPTDGFKLYYNDWYVAKGMTKRYNQKINKVSSFAATYMQDIMTNSNSEYKWLGDYILSVATAAGVTLSTDMNNANEGAWRWAVHAFFNAEAGQNGAKGIDFTTAGQPSAWGPAYIAAHSRTKVEPQPTQEELWTNFMTDYKTYFNVTNNNSYAHTNASGFLYSCRTSSGNTIEVGDLMSDADSGWEWLGNYIESIAGKATDNELWWRTQLHAFFAQIDGYKLSTINAANFSTAGQPAAWKAAWDAAHTTSADPETSLYTLPDFIDETFTLPTASSNPRIYHPSEYTFLGWIDQTGANITELSVGYKGTVYAQWNSPIKWVLNGGAYTGHHELPLTVDEEYYLPTAFAMRKEGYKFAGWYDNASFTGEVITTILANYTGTLYAKWGEATHVTWHPYPYYDVTNEDLWELFIEDYNAFYQNRYILGEKVSSGAKSYQPMTNAFGFTFSLAADKEKDGFRDGRLKDFMTHPKSPWRWLGEYITEVLEEENESLDSNAPLWTSFKEATGLTQLGALEKIKISEISGALNGVTILVDLFAKPEWTWLRDYIMTTQNAQKGNAVGTRTVPELTTDIANEGTNWRYAVAAFFKQSQHTDWPATADFSTAGKHSVWKDIIPEEYHDLGHFRITNELEWRKTVAAFFNHTNVLTYTLNSGISKTEGTADFRNLGLPKPNGDPAAGWYNAWWNATFPEYMINGETLPRVKRYGYVFGGWYYGNEKGYIFTEANKANPTAYNSANNYKNHLWGRWLELCLYEGYVDSDPAALDANEQPISPKVNNNVEMVICNAEEIDRTKLSRKVDVERKLIGSTYNTMFLPFGINGDPKMDKTIDGKTHFLSQVVDDNGNPLLNPATTSILVYDNAVVENIGGEEVIAYNFHEYAQEDQFESLAPYKPFLIKPENDITVRMHFWSALMQAPANAGARTSAVQAFVEGVLAPTMLPVNPEHDNTLILVADNRLAKVTTQGEMLGLRLYFTVPKDVSPSARSIIRVNNAPAGIDDIETPQQGAAVIKIMQNGNIYIIRNGKMYDIMGREIGDRR